MFKVEIRETCKECDNPITNKRSRTYCSPQCRNKAMNKKYAKQHVEWGRAKRDREATKKSDKKVQCLICKKWYIQVCTHVLQVHGITAKEYKEEYELEVKRGIVPKWYRELKGEQAISNGTFENLKAGAKYRFKKGDQKAGRYKRSPITLERLRNLKQNFKKNV